jgi:hypothetical protein
MASPNHLQFLDNTVDATLAPDFSSISDLVEIAENGIEHLEHLNPLSVDNMEDIVDNQDLIRELEFDRVTYNEECSQLFFSVAYSLRKYSNLAAKRDHSVITPKATKKKVHKARIEFEDNHARFMKWSANQTKYMDLEERIKISKAEDKLAAQRVGRELTNSSIDLGKKSWIADRWSHWGGGDKWRSRERIKGMSKKAGALAVIGFVPAAVVAGATLAVAGPAVGAVGIIFAVGASRGSARGLIRGNLDSKAEAINVARIRNDSNVAEQHARIDEAYDEPIDHDDIHNLVNNSVSNSFGESNSEQIHRNRTRVVAAFAIGVTVGAAGAVVGEIAHNLIFSGSKHPNAATRPQPKKMSTTTKDASPSHPTHTSNAAKPSFKPTYPTHHGVQQQPHLHVSKDAHGIIGQSIQVHAGESEIGEIEHYAYTHNYHVTPDQASNIYAHLFKEHGSHIIKLDGPGPSTYTISPGEIGLRHPGEAHFYHGIEAEIRRRLAQLDTKTKKTSLKSKKLALAGK